MELISVMIPTRNRAAYLKEALESVLAQDYRPLEIIVADDGSTDGTAELVKKYDPEIVKYHFKSGPEHNITASRNFCLSKAHGDYLAWLDDDDLYLPGKLSAQKQYLDEHPDCALVFTMVEDFLDDLTLQMDSEICGKIIFADTKVYHASILARKNLYALVGKYNKITAAREDQDWLYRAHFAHHIDLSHCLKKVYLRRRLHDGCNSYNLHTKSELLSAARAVDKYIRDKVRKSLIAKRENQ